MERPSPVNRFYATFGAGQYAGLLANNYVSILAPDSGAAAIAMNQMFGNHGWSNVYTEHQRPTSIDKYHLVSLGTVRVEWNHDHTDVYVNKVAV